MIWMFAGSSLTKLILAAGGAALLFGPLNTPDTWVAGHSPYAPPLAMHMASASSLQGMARAMKADDSDVVLDVERWPLTPVGEQQHPVRTYRLASELAASHWESLIATPAFDLVKAVEPNYRGRIYPEFIRLDLAGRIAPYAQVYEIQAQGIEQNTAQYRLLVNTIAHQVRAVNPKVIILAGLSTNPSGKVVRADSLIQDVRDTQSIVQGYWLNIPQAGLACPTCGTAKPSVAIRLLNSVTAMRFRNY
jgi:hypothetical protein